MNISDINMHPELTMIDIDVNGPQDKIIVAYEELDEYIEMCDADIFLDWFNEAYPESAGVAYDFGGNDFDFVHMSDYIEFYQAAKELLANNQKCAA